MVNPDSFAEQERFLFVGGHPSLDFVNTEVIDHGKRTDLLRGFKDLSAWLAQAGLMDEGETVDAARKWHETDEGRDALAQARELRREIRNAAQAVSKGNPLPATFLEAVNGVLCERVGYEQFELGDGMCRKRWRFQLSKASHLLAPIAQAAGDFFCLADPTLVKKCGNPACILFFYDTTKNRARRWCSMSVCGNRMKVAAHQRRSKIET